MVESHSRKESREGRKYKAFLTGIIMQVIIKNKSKRLKVDNVKKLSEFGKVIGLMFHSREKCPSMLFEFSSPTKMKIHSIFVFFPFAAIWTDDKNRIIDKKIVKPFRISIGPKKPFYKLVEIPLNRKYVKKVKTLFGKY
ncbi:MAG: hypothetical protein ACP5NZ_04550 [Nanobdellota archaeon]